VTAAERRGTAAEQRGTAAEQRGTAAERRGTAAERARLFVALELPDHARGTLARWRDDAVETFGSDRLRPVTADSLHVTLCFLGWCSLDDVEAIAAACGVAAARPVARLTLGRVVWLPRRRPGVLAVELNDAGARLGAVQATLSASLASGGWYVPEQRPFYPHVTVARVRKGPRIRGAELAKPEPLGFEGEAVTLFRSRLARSGARYEPLASIHLRADAGAADSSRASSATSGEPSPET
jgi:2'-5' RNA ligase